MTSMPPASREEIVALLGDVDESFVERVRDSGASVDEIAEAIEELEDRFVEARHLPSSERVAAVRQVLAELLDASGPPTSFPIGGTPIGRSI